MNDPERQRHGVTALLVFSAMCGPGWSYGPVYLFHPVLLVAWVWLIRTDGLDGLLALIRDQRGVLLPMGLCLAWWSASLCWSVDLGEAMASVVLWWMGAALVLAVLLLVRNGALLRTALRAAGTAIVVELFVAVLEITTPFRWPISRLSDHAARFGHPTDIAALLVEPGSAGYLATSPTGFHWNENDLAALVLLALPFFFLSRRWWVWILAAGLTGWIVIATGARLGWAGLLLAMVALLVGWKGRRGVALLGGVVILLISTNGGSPRYHPWKKVRETQVFSRMVVGADLDTAQLRALGDLGLTDGSAGARKALFGLGLRAIGEHPLLGLGAGGTRAYIRGHWPADRRPVSDLHCWWLQVPAEGGVVMLILYLVWWGRIGRDLVRATRASSGLARDTRMAACLALLVLIPVAVMPSSMIYFLPMHLLAALAIGLSRYSPTDAHAPSR